MASRIEIYSVYRVAAMNVLLRVTRRESSNTDEADCSAAIAEAYQRREQLLQFALDSLTVSLDSDAELIGEFQDIPVGELLFNAPDGSTLDVWVTQTESGKPWVVLGTATDESEFWQELQDDDDLMSLGPCRPAELMHVHYFADRVL